MGKVGERFSIPLGTTALCLHHPVLNIENEVAIHLYDLRTGVTENLQSHTKRFKAISRLAGLDERVHFHSFRHP